MLLFAGPTLAAQPRAAVLRAEIFHSSHARSQVRGLEPGVEPEVHQPPGTRDVLPLDAGADGGERLLEDADVVGGDRGERIADVVAVPSGPRRLTLLSRRPATR